MGIVSRISVAPEQNMLERLEHKVSARLKHNRVIPSEAPRDFHVIWLTMEVKQSPVHWFGGLTRYVEVLWSLLVPSSYRTPAAGFCHLERGYHTFFSTVVYRRP